MYLDTNLAGLQTEQDLALVGNQLTTIGASLDSGIQSLGTSATSLLAEGTNLSSAGTIASQTLQNLQQGQSMVQTAMGSTQSAIQLVEQLQSFAVQASGADVNSEQRAQLQTQMQTVLSQINQLAATTRYGPTSLEAPDNVQYVASPDAAVTTIDNEPNMLPGNYTLTMAAQGAYLDATLTLDGTTVATGTAVNPWVMASLSASAWTTENASATGAATVANGTWPDGQPILEATLPPGGSYVQSSIAVPIVQGSDNPNAITIAVDGADGLNYIHPAHIYLGPMGGDNFNYAPPDNPGWETTLGSGGTFSGSTTSIELINGDPTFTWQIGAILVGYGSNLNQASVSIAWHSTVPGFLSSELNLTYNPAQFADDGGHTAVHFQVTPTARYVGNPMASIAITPNVFGTLALGLDGMSLTTPESAQSAIAQSRLSLQVLSTIQEQLGIQVAAIQTASHTAQTQVLNATAGSAGLLGVNLPTATQQLSRRQWLFQSGLQMLTTEDRLARHTATTLATITTR